MKKRFTFPAVVPRGRPWSCTKRDRRSVLHWDIREIEGTQRSTSLSSTADFRFLFRSRSDGALNFLGGIMNFADEACWSVGASSILTISGRLERSSVRRSLALRPKFDNVWSCCIDASPAMINKNDFLSCWVSFHFKFGWKWRKNNGHRVELSPYVAILLVSHEILHGAGVTSPRIKCFRQNDRRPTLYTITRY